MIAYHGKPEVKETYLTRVRAHAAADEIIQGVTWENGKGCAVGCTLHTYDHRRYERELGLPEWLARLEDTIFEGLPNEQAKLFPEQFLSAIPVGANLEPVKWKFCAFLMRENIERVTALAIGDVLKKQVIDAVRQCLAVHESAIASGKWDESVARSVARSARSAWSAARSVASVAESVAEAAARSAAWSAELAWLAWSAESAFIRYKDELLRLLQEAK